MANKAFSEFEFIQVEDRGIVRLATINRPAKANALNSQTLAELDRVVQITSVDETIRLFAVTGSGQKVFSAGADLSEATSKNLKSDSAKAYDRRWDELTSRIAALPCISAALLNGACIGGGLSIALAFDFRIGAPHAYFRYPVAQHGFMPSPTDLERLKSVAGAALVRKLLLLGETIPMTVAHTRGLADDIAADDDVWKVLDRLAALVKHGKARSQLAIKRLISADGSSDRVTEDCYRAVYDADQNSFENLWRNSST